MEKHSYKELLSKVGLSKSQMSCSTPAQAKNRIKDDEEKSQRQSPEVSSRNNRSKSRYSRKSLEKQYDSTDRR